MRHYAEQTKVSPTATMEQIKKLLRAAGATRFGTDEGEEFAQIGFQMHGRTIRFRVDYPSPEDREFTHTEAYGYRREPAKARELWEKAIRQRWRALHLIIKAKLEAIHSGVVTWEEEMLPYTLLRNGQTVAEYVATEQRLQALMEPHVIDVTALPPGDER